MLHFTKSPKLVLVHITSPPVELAQRQQIDQSAVGSSLATRRVPSQTSTAA